MELYTALLQREPDSSDYYRARSKAHYNLGQYAAYQARPGGR